MENKNKYIIWAVTVIIITMVWIYLNNIITTLETKNTIFKDSIEELETKVNTKSDIEMLDFYASESKMYSEYRLETIAELKEELKLVEWLYEFEILQVRCYKSQIDRKINWLEYQMDFCKSQENLDTFRKKY